MKKLTVELNENSYPIIIRDGALEDIRTVLDEHFGAAQPGADGKPGAQKRYFVIVNKTVFKLYKDTIAKLVDTPETLVIIEDGEKYKNFKTLEKIMDKLLKAKIERKDVIVAFGGGVTGDLAGFAAACVLRGVDYVQVPTTLLAQVDSSVGGKTGFNHQMGKNLIGAFKQPKLVLIDPKTLDTLDIRQIKTGLGEVLKYAFIEKTAGAKEVFNFFEHLKNILGNTQTEVKIGEKELLERLKPHWEDIIYTSVSMKAAVVAKDEREQGLRAILNFGHTFAHSIEKMTHYKKYTHGEAVAAGMVMAFNTARLKNLVTEEYYTAAVSLIKDYGLILADMKNFNKEKMYAGMKSDKKVQNAKIRLVLPVSPFEVQIFDDTKEPLIKESLL